MARPLPLPLAFALATWLALTACEKPAPAEPGPAPGQAAASQASRAKGPAPAQKAMAADGALQISPEDACPVCGMRPHKHPKFASGVELEDGTTYYTCGTGCMIRTYLHPDRYLGHDAKPIKRLMTPDYFTGKPLDALQAHWIYGSGVVGPMGPAFVPLATEADVMTFRERHGGAHQFELPGLTAEKFGVITGRSSMGK